MVEEQSPEQAIEVLRTIAVYIREGHPYQLHEPSPRGRKGPAREAHRIISVTVLRPAVLDSISWRLMRERFRRQ